MRRGERAWVYVQDPRYGYGERGSFSFPCVPPNASLVYDVQLLGFEAIDDVRHKRRLLVAVLDRNCTARTCILTDPGRASLVFWCMQGPCANDRAFFCIPYSRLCVCARKPCRVRACAFCRRAMVTVQGCFMRRGWSGPRGVACRAMNCSRPRSLGRL